MRRGQGQGAPAGARGAGPAPDMLAASAAEAARIASALAGFDHALAGAMLAARQPGGAAPFGRLAAILQGIDLVRQEAEGLARLLHLLAGEQGDSPPPSAEALAGALTLEAQRLRLFAGRFADAGPGPA